MRIHAGDFLTLHLVNGKPHGFDELGNRLDDEVRFHLSLPSSSWPSASRFERRHRRSNQFPFQERKPFQRASRRLRTARFMSGASGTVELSASNRAQRESTIFVQPGASGSRSILGVFADEASNTLWACSNDLSALGAPATGSDTGSALKAFDLKTGNGKRSVSLPGSHAFCNDIAVDAKGSVYVTDSANPTILKLSAGATAFDVFAQDSSFSAPQSDGAGLDGIAFGSDGNLYVTNYTAGELVRVEVKGGRAGRITALSGNHQLKFPDATSNPRQQQFPPGRGLRNIRSRGDPRRHIRRHAGSWRFCDPDVGCPDRHDCVGE